MAKEMKQKEITATRMAAYMIIGQAIILVSAFLITAFIFFRQAAVEIYEELDRSITGAILSVTDEEVMADLAKEAVQIYKSIDDPAALYENDKETYFGYFSDLQNSEAYLNMRAQVNDIRRNTASTCITLAVLFPGENRGLYVFDSSDYNVMDCGELFEADTSGYAENPGMRFRSFITESPTYGLVRTDGFSCCSDPDAGVYSYLLSDIPISAVIRRSNAFIINTGIVAVLLALFIIASVAALLKKRVVDPLQEISDRAQKFVKNRSMHEGDTNFFETLDGGNIKEMNELTGSLRTMESEMNEYIRDLEKMTAEKSRLGTELALAESIQTNMLPNICHDRCFLPDHDRLSPDLAARTDPVQSVFLQYDLLSGICSFCHVCHDHVHSACGPDVQGSRGGPDEGQ